MKKLTTCMWLMGAMTAHAQTDTMVVFDASGSMWGQIEGTTKIEIARDAVSEISQGFAADQTVGLMAYGHRRKGDCSDIETLVAPTAGSASAIQTAVKSLQPKGKTPLSQAVKLAAETMKYTENKATVVLITDGVETCDMDPCSVASELEQLGIDFTAHVIGFGLSVDQGKQVSCMADATGGIYLPAADANSLNQALEQVVAVQDEPEVAVELPSATVTGPSEEVVIGANFAVEWTGPSDDLDFIDVVPEGDDRVYGSLSYQWSEAGSPAQLRAPGKVGTYEVRYIWQGPKQKHILARDSFVVVDSEVALVAPDEVMAGTHFEVSWQGPDRPDDYIDLVRQGDQRTYGELSYFYTKSGTPGSILAPAAAGTYDLRYVLEAAGGRQILYRIPIQVKAAEVTLAFQPEAEIAARIPVFWTGPNNKDGYIDVVAAGYNKTYGEIGYFYLRDNPDSGELLMPVEPGDYLVRFIMKGGDGRQVIHSRPIKVIDVPASLTAPGQAAPESDVTVQWTGPNRKGDYVDVVPANYNRTYGEKGYFYTQGNPDEGSMKLPSEPGQYKIRYVLQGKERRVLAEQPITVE